MPDGHLRIPLVASFWAANDRWISAAISLAAAVLLAFVADRAFRRHGRRLELSRGVDTRLRFVRRVVYAAILIVGAAIALSQFTGIKRSSASPPARRSPTSSRA
jgi:small-conductance mechanosensitive channel